MTAFYANTELDTADVAAAIFHDYEAALDLIIRIVENIADSAFDNRVIAMIQEG